MLTTVSAVSPRDHLIPGEYPSQKERIGLIPSEAVIVQPGIPTSISSVLLSFRNPRSLSRFVIALRILRSNYGFGGSGLLTGLPDAQKVGKEAKEAG